MKMVEQGMCEGLLDEDVVLIIDLALVELYNTLDPNIAALELLVDQ